MLGETSGTDHVRFVMMVDGLVEVREIVRGLNTQSCQGKLQEPPRQPCCFLHECLCVDVCVYI